MKKIMFLMALMVVVAGCASQTVQVLPNNTLEEKPENKFCKNSSKVIKCGDYYRVSPPEPIPDDAPDYLFDKNGRNIAACGGNQAEESEKCSIECENTNLCNLQIDNSIAKQKQDKEYCESKGAEYKGFRNGCMDNCRYKRNPKEVICPMNAPWGCYCGENKCWNGSGCENL